jgi:hypothetical protein
MRRIAFLFCAATLAGCTKSETNTTADTTPVAAPVPEVAAPAPAPVSLAQVAGKWDVKVTNEAGDSTLTQYVLTATADKSGWSIKFPSGLTVPMQVTSVAGDSITTAAGPYSSVLRKGVKVSTEGTFRLQDGKIVGTTIAHYKVSTPDSVLHLKMAGTSAK